MTMIDQNDKLIFPAKGDEKLSDLLERTGIEKKKYSFTPYRFKELTYDNAKDIVGSEIEVQGADVFNTLKSRVKEIMDDFDFDKDYIVLGIKIIEKENSKRIQTKIMNKI